MHHFQTFHKTVMVALCISPRCYYAESHLFLCLNPILRASFCYLGLGICQRQEGGRGWRGCEFSLSEFILGSLTSWAASKVTGGKGQNSTFRGTGTGVGRIRELLQLSMEELWSSGLGVPSGLGRTVRKRES